MKTQKKLFEVGFGPGLAAKDAVLPSRWQGLKARKALQH